MWVNAQHLMHRLAPFNRVLYVNNLGLRPPGRSRGDWSKVRKRVGEWFSGAVEVEKNLWVVSPVSIPLHHWFSVQKLNQAALTHALVSHLHRLNFHNPILWSFLPLGSSLCGRLGESLVIYHCVDDYAANPGVAANELRAMEQRLLSAADLVLTTNPVLYQERKTQTRYAVYLGNVAQTSHFEPDPARSIPAEMEQVPRPILGYQGNISGYKTDLPLLIALAKAMPQAGIVLVGPVGWGDPGTDISALKSLPNVHFIGRVAFSDLPAYVSAFDVGLLPLRDNESTRRSFPMKFYEYMAAGKPIVATDLPAFAPYRERTHLCRLADNHPAFIKAVQDALADSDLHLSERIAEARANSWDVRVEQISRLVAEALALKEGPR